MSSYEALVEHVAETLWIENEHWRERSPQLADNFRFPYKWLIEPTKEHLRVYAEAVLGALRREGWELVAPRAAERSEGLPEPLGDLLAEAGSAD